MNALILKGHDVHTYRLEQGLQSCNVKTFTVEHYIDIPSDKYDIVFVDPSFPYDVGGSKLNSDRVVFFDCEDDPLHFDPGEAYDSLKDKCLYYVKMNYRDEDHREDGIKNIGMPLNIFGTVAQVAQLEVPKFTFRNAVPYLLAAPTFIGSYTPVEGGHYATGEGVSSLGVFDDGMHMYNQRLDWLLSMRNSHLFHVGGIVFKEDNLSVDWQSKYFGEVEPFQMNPVSWQDHIQHLFNYRIALCPTGHDRMSWRVFDIMATGGILFWTDVGNQKSLYMPKEFIKVKDGEDIATKILNSQKDFYNMWEASQENRKVFASLTPEKVMEDFLEQMI